MAKATLLLDYRAAQGDLIIRMVLWQLPRPTKDRPHGLKYRLYLGRRGRNVIRYDNETGKGDHRHVGPDEVESPYQFLSPERLLEDFRSECEQLGWRWSE